MEFSILVEPVAQNGFRASSGEPLGLHVEAPTRGEAIAKLRQQIAERVDAGAEVLTLELGNSHHPLSPFAGSLKDDPLLEPWKNAMAEYREQSNRGTDDE